MHVAALCNIMLQIDEELMSATGAFSLDQVSPVVLTLPQES